MRFYTKETSKCALFYVQAHITCLHNTCWNVKQEALSYIAHMRNGSFINKTNLVTGYHNNSTKSLVKNNQNVIIISLLRISFIWLRIPLTKGLFVPCLLEIAKVFEFFKSQYCIPLPILRLFTLRKNLWPFIWTNMNTL